MSTGGHGRQSVSKGVHTPFAWKFADAAARTGFTPSEGLPALQAQLTSADLDRVGLQEDDGTLWRLTATTPTWAAVGGSVGGGGDVVGPGSSTDNAVARFDSTTGKIIQNSAVTIDDSGNIATSGTVDGRDVSADGSDLDTHIADTANPHNTDLGNLGSGTLAELNALVTDATLDDASDPRTPTAHSITGAAHTFPGGTTTYLRADGTFAAPAGAGDVVGPGSSTDNAIARFDLTTGKIIQNSVVTIDDSGNIATAGTVDGRDISADGSDLDGHIADTANPHNTDLGNLGSGTLAELNALVTDATLDDASDPRDPTTHAASHLPGGSDALTTAAPGATGVATASGVGSNASFARSDHTHQSNTAPADVTKATAAIGTSGEPARADHKHDISTATAGASQAGASAAEGTATSLARSDHAHSVAVATPASIGATNVEGVATTFVRGDHVHAHGAQTDGAMHAAVVAAGASGFMTGSDKTKLDGIATGAAALTATSPVDITKATAVVGVGTTAARHDHKHDVSTAAAVAVGTTNAEGTATSLARSDHTHQVTGLAIASEAQGDVLYRNASAWVRLAAGTSGHFLRTAGAAANPTWASAGDVVGPSSSVDNTLPRFDSTSGKLLQSSGIVVSDTNAVSGILTATFPSEINAGNSSTAITLDFTTGQKLRVTLTANTTFTFTFPGVGNYVLKITQDGTGARTITLPGSARATSGVVNVSSAASSVTLLAIYWDGTNSYISSMPGVTTATVTLV